MRTLRWWLVLLALLCAGCFSPHKAARRAAIEQQVTSAAIQVATLKLDLSGLDPQRPYRVEASGLNETDLSWVSLHVQQGRSKRRASGTDARKRRAPASSVGSRDPARGWSRQLAESGTSTAHDLVKAECGP